MSNDLCSMQTGRQCVCGDPNLERAAIAAKGKKFGHMYPWLGG